MKNLNYKLQRQHLKAFRKALPHVDSIVSQGSEFHVTYATFKSISEWFTFMKTLVSELLVTKTETHTNTKELRELDDEALDLL